MRPEDKNPKKEGAEKAEPLSETVENAHAVGDGSVGRDKDWMVEEVKESGKEDKEKPPY